MSRETPSGSSTTVIKKPDIFSFRSYRDYLKAYESFARENISDFSHRQFAKKAGFATSSLLRMLIDGKSNLSPDGAKRIAKALGLNGEARNFFCTLVHYNQAKSSKDSLRFYEQLLKIDQFRRRYPLAESQLRYFRHWYYPAIREFISSTGMIENAEELSKRLRPEISTSQAQVAIDDLVGLGLLERTDDKLFPKASTVSTSNEVSSSLLADFHRQTLELAIRSIEEVAGSDRDLRTLTLRIDPTRMPELKKFMLTTIHQMIEKFEAPGEAPSAVYQVNLLAFPVSQTKA